MTRAATHIRPSDHGRRMTLDEFRTADAPDGVRCELSRGIITVSNVANRRHYAMVNAVRQQLSRFEAAQPGIIQSMAGGGDCKIVIDGLESERHPDWAVYKSPMPQGVADDEELWATWVPDLVIEVVSPDSAARDYEEKPEEYLRFGIPLYWIIDEERQEMLVLRRVAARYVRRIIRPGQVYAPVLLKGLEFDVAAVFEAARGAGT